MTCCSTTMFWAHHKLCWNIFMLHRWVPYLSSIYISDIKLILRSNGNSRPSYSTQIILNFKCFCVKWEDGNSYILYGYEICAICRSRKPAFSLLHSFLLCCLEEVKLHHRKKIFTSSFAYIAYCNIVKCVVYKIQITFLR